MRKPKHLPGAQSGFFLLNTVAGFLEANGVSVADAEKGAQMLNGPDLADHARPVHSARGRCALTLNARGTGERALGRYQN